VTGRGAFARERKGMTLEVGQVVHEDLRIILTSPASFEPALECDDTISPMLGSGSQPRGSHAFLWMYCSGVPMNFERHSVPQK
jgi:hypothetical protein